MSVKYVAITVLFMLFVSSVFAGVEFDGTDDVVTIPYSSSCEVDNDTALTICCWVYVDGQDSGADTIVMTEAVAEGDGNENVRLYITDGSTSSTYKFNCSILDADGNSVVVTESGEHSDGDGWHHVCMVLRSSDNYLRLFVDGVETGTPGLVSNGIGTNFDSGENWRIGSGEATRTRFFDGKLEELYFFKETGLSDSQIATLAKSKIRGIGLAWLNMGFYLPLNEGTVGTSANGSTVQDVSKNDNDGTGNYGSNSSGLVWIANTILKSIGINTY